MPAEVDLPTSLAHLPYFILRYHREVGTYELIEPHKTNSYMIGDAVKTRGYFWSLNMEHLGGRAMDSALAFGTSQALIKEGRAFGLDLCKVDLDAGIVRKDELDDNRWLDGEVEEDAEFISGLPKPQ